MKSLHQRFIEQVKNDFILIFIILIFWGLSTMNYNEQRKIMKMAKQ